MRRESHSLDDIPLFRVSLLLHNTAAKVTASLEESNVSLLSGFTLGMTDWRRLDQLWPNDCLQYVSTLPLFARLATVIH